MSEEPDFAELLHGLDGQAREARLKLLQELHDDGCTMQELREAAAEDRLVLLPVDRALAVEAHLTREEIADRVGVDVETLRASRRSLGLPVGGDDERLFGELDLEVAEGLKVLLDAGVPLDRVVEANRVIARSMVQVAAAMRRMVSEAVLAPELSEYDAALVIARAADELTPRMTPVLAYGFQGHLREILRSDAISAADIAEGRTAGARDLAVAFADLVGFTRMGEEVPAEEVGDVVRRLETVAFDLAERPVTVVKTIGDAVMLVSPEPDPLLDVALGLVEADLPDLRVGVAYGTALERDGDFYGSPVNQADRVTAVARPSSVLVTQSVRDTARRDWDWSFARERKLKGVGEVKLFRARRPSAGDGASGS